MTDMETFRKEVETFLAATLPPKPDERPFTWGVGSDDVAFFEQASQEAEREEVAASCAYRRQRFDAGLGWITGPIEWGGRELGQEFELAFNELERRYQAPSGACFTIGLGMVAPTVLAHATAPAKERYLRGLHRGDVLACQLFSEPGAGSDLANVQTRAERDGDEWVLTGQKVWTSGAHYAHIGEVIARTDSSLPKHQGLTAFLVDMKAPGVEVRPLRQMTGGANFNEVFFTEVRIPDDHRLGEVNAGWQVALTTLMNERATIGKGGGGGVDKLVLRLPEMVRAFGLDRDPLIRNRVADVLLRFRVAEMTNLRGLAQTERGRRPGPEMSIGKLASAINSSLFVNLVCDIVGTKLTADTGEWGTYAWTQTLLGDAASHIAGGTDQVMRNILGERVLGLPKEPGIDTTSPFRDLPQGR